MVIAIQKEVQFQKYANEQLQSAPTGTRLAENGVAGYSISGMSSGDMGLNEYPILQEHP